MRHAQPSALPLVTDLAEQRHEDELDDVLDRARGEGVVQRAPQGDGVEGGDGRQHGVDVGGRVGEDGLAPLRAAARHVAERDGGREAVGHRVTLRRRS